MEATAAGSDNNNNDNNNNKSSSSTAGSMGGRSNSENAIISELMTAQVPPPEDVSLFAKIALEALSTIRFPTNTTAATDDAPKNKTTTTTTSLSSSTPSSSASNSKNNSNINKIDYGNTNHGFQFGDSVPFGSSLQQNAGGYASLFVSSLPAFSFLRGNYFSRLTTASTYPSSYESRMYTSPSISGAMVNANETNSNAATSNSDNSSSNSVPSNNNNNNGNRDSSMNENDKKNKKNNNSNNNKQPQNLIDCFGLWHRPRQKKDQLVCYGILYIDAATKEDYERLTKIYKCSGIRISYIGMDTIEDNNNNSDQNSLKKDIFPIQEIGTGAASGTTEATKAITSNPASNKGLPVIDRIKKEPNPESEFEYTKFKEDFQKVVIRQWKHSVRLMEKIASGETPRQLYQALTRSFQKHYDTLVSKFNKKDS